MTIRNPAEPQVLAAQELPSERKILLLIAAVQFVNVLDFMMVMPLGPDFAQELGIATSHLGVVGGAYTAAAAVSGILGATFLDRFDRRSALVAAVLGLVAATALGGLATGFYSLIGARVLAGAFGGPATSVALAIVADTVPVERRGRAMGVVMSSFSVASVLGVPMGLKLATMGGWRTPFFAVAALGLLVALLGIPLLPSMRAHLSQERGTLLGLLSILRRPVVALSLLTTVVSMTGHFALIPNLSAYLQFNLGYPRADLGLLYMAGGLVSFATLRIAGRLTDRVGPWRSATIGSVLYVTTLYLGFIHSVMLIPVMLLFVMFMVTGSFRFVPMQALSSRVPHPTERARFMSLQSCVQHMAAASGALFASQVLAAEPDGKLVGMNHVAMVTASLAALLPFMLALVESKLAPSGAPVRVDAPRA
ncbi:MAG: MFS transporter [Myxococcales bacterium]